MNERLRKLIDLLEWRETGTKDGIPVVKQRWKYTEMAFEFESEEEMKLLDKELRKFYKCKNCNWE